MLFCVIPICVLITGSPSKALLAMQPLEIAATDSDTRKLQKERFNEHLRDYQNWERRYNMLTCSPPPFLWGLSSITPLTAAGAALDNGPRNQLEWAEIRFAVLWTMERCAKIRVEVGNEPPQYLHIARAARLDAEIDLLKLRESLKVGK